MSMDLTEIQKIISRTYKEEEYPALLEQMQVNRKRQPLKGVRVLDATPVYRNTLVKHLALLAAGAELTAGISDVMAHDPKVVALLQHAGIRVVHANDTPAEQDLILDCAASFSAWNPLWGVSELTRSGVEIYKKSNKPVFLADAGRIKRIETCLGTGESYFRAMNQLGYKEWAGRKLVVFGTGKVGTGIIYYASRLGADVHVVTDPSTLLPRVREMVTSSVHYADSSAVASTLQGAYAVVTATGVRDALASRETTESLLQSGALLANMGVEDEYGPGIPRSSVLMKKRTLNFILEEPTHLKYIDATMALHNEGAFYLLDKGVGKGLILPPVATEEQILSVTREKGCIGEELDWI